MKKNLFLLGLCYLGHGHAYAAPWSYQQIQTYLNAYEDLIYALTKNPLQNEKKPVTVDQGLFPLTYDDFFRCASGAIQEGDYILHPYSVLKDSTDIDAFLAYHTKEKQSFLIEGTLPGTTLVYQGSALGRLFIEEQIKYSTEFRVSQRKINRLNRKIELENELIALYEKIEDLDKQIKKDRGATEENLQNMHEDDVLKNLYALYMQKTNKLDEKSYKEDITNSRSHLSENYDLSLKESEILNQKLTEEALLRKSDFQDLWQQKKMQAYDLEKRAYEKLEANETLHLLRDKTGKIGKVLISSADFSDTFSEIFNKPLHHKEENTLQYTKEQLEEISKKLSCSYETVEKAAKTFTIEQLENFTNKEKFSYAHIACKEGRWVKENRVDIKGSPSHIRFACAKDDVWVFGLDNEDNVYETALYKNGRLVDQKKQDSRIKKLFGPVFYTRKEGYLEPLEYTIPELYDLEKVSKWTNLCTTYTKKGMLCQNEAQKISRAFKEDAMVQSDSRLDDFPKESDAYIRKVDFFRVQHTSENESFSIPVHVTYPHKSVRDDVVMVHIHGGPHDFYDMVNDPDRLFFGSRFPYVTTNFPGSKGYDKLYEKALYQQKDHYKIAGYITSILSDITQQRTAEGKDTKFILRGESFGAYGSLCTALHNTSHNILAVICKYGAYDYKAMLQHDTNEESLRIKKWQTYFSTNPLASVFFAKPSNFLSIERICQQPFVYQEDWQKFDGRAISSKVLLSKDDQKLAQEILIGEPASLDKASLTNKVPLYKDKPFSVYLTCGEEDLRCPKAETKNMAKILEENGYPVTEWEMKDAGHGAYTDQMKCEDLKRECEFIKGVLDLSIDLWDESDEASHRSRLSLDKEDSQDSDEKSLCKEPSRKSSSDMKKSLSDCSLEGADEDAEEQPLRKKVKKNINQ